MPALELVFLPDRLAVCRLPAGAAIPAGVLDDAGSLACVVRTGDELSLVIPADRVPEGVRCVVGWRALRVAGTLDFSLVGVLHALIGPLADAGLSIFALSTYDTDYVLVRENSEDRAVAALRGAGFRVTIS
jgi:hypothetical protein